MTKHRNIRPATRPDLEQFYGQFPWSFRAVTLEIDEEVLAVGGVYYDGGTTVAFSSMEDGTIEDNPMASARMVVETMKIISGRACIAIASDKFEQAPALLKRLGFEHMEEETYRWTP